MSSSDIRMEKTMYTYIYVFIYKYTFVFIHIYDIYFINISFFLFISLRACNCETSAKGEHAIMQAPYE